MLPAWIPTDTATLLMLGLGLATLGIVVLLTRGLPSVAAFLIATSGSVAVVVLSDHVFSGPPRTAGVLVAIAGLSFVFWMARWRWVGARALRLGRIFKRPVVQAAFTLLLGSALVVFAAARSEVVEDGLPDGILDQLDEGARSFHELEGLQAVTDRGRKIALLVPDETKEASDSRARQMTTNAHQLIQTAVRDAHVNCHGWVFTMGQAWVRGNAVDGILEDNGYEVVKNPGPGDVIVYRGVDGAVLHSGIVRGMSGDDRVLIESKWGALGIYIHFAGDTGYGDGYKYYRTSRSNHLLSGVPLPSPSSAVVRRG